MPTREEMKRLAREIVSSYESRVEGVSLIRKETQAQLQELDRAHNAMARQQRQGLAKGRADLGASVSAQLQELDGAHNVMARQQREGLAKGRADLGASVSAQVHELDRAHHAMARQQREVLAKAHADLNRAETRRKAGVHSWMEEVAAAHGAAREEWQNLAATMQARRAGAVAAPPSPAVEEVARAIPHTEEEAVERAVVGEVTSELVSVSDRVFTYLANHPDGTRLTELEREFGLGRFQAARAVRHLINEGKAQKRELHYFAI